MQPNRSFLSVLLILAATVVGTAQMAGKYYFYKGDTLNGFDVTACYKDALLYADEHHLNDYEKLLYVRGRESYFVEQKYGFQNHPKKTVHVTPVVTVACNNLGFESGDFTGWTGAIGYNFNSNTPLTVTSPVISTKGLDYPEPYCSYHTLVDAAAGNDIYGLFPMLDPGGGTYALRLGGEWINMAGPDTGAGGSPADSCVTGTQIAGKFYAGGEMIQQTFVVTKANAMFTYNYAVLLDQATHNNGECPYFKAEVLNQAGDTIPCLQYYVQSNTATPPAGMTVSAKKNGFNQPIFFLPWTSNSINLQAYLSQTVTVRFTAAGCTHGGHRGYAYVDATCGPVQVIASSPQVCLGGTIDLTAPAAGAAGVYAWSTVPPGGPGISGSNTSQTVTLDASGTYEVKVTQPNGCFYTIDTAIVFYPNPLVKVTSTNATCSPGNDGTATATVTGVPPGYTLLWTPAPPSGANTPNATGMSGGSYNCMITTQNGCKDDTTITIIQPPGAPVVSLSTTPATCSPGADGTITATVTGGNAPTYTWSGPGAAPSFTGNGQGTLNATGLSGGTYIFTATPAGGICPVSQTIVVTQPNAPTATQTTTNVSCFGLSDGTDTVKAFGGTAPLTFAWTGGPVITDGNASGLAAGTYVCTISDAKGCKLTETAVITQPSQLTVTATGIPASCAGKCNGQVIGVPGGGTTVYTYGWIGTACTSASCSNVCAGNYTINITDAHGCKATASTTVTEPPPIVMTMFPKPSHCNKPDGSDSVFVSGGASGFSYSWKPGPASAKSGDHNLPAGTYTVVVKDANGCLDSSNNVVPNLPGVNITQVSSTPVSCFGGHDGTAKDSASGGFKPYTYLWTNGAGTAATATGLAAGPYTCTVTDSAGCTNSVPVTITQPPLLTLTASPPVTICIGQCTDLTAAAAGGTTPYTYVWTQGATVFTNTHVCPILTTTYTVNCTDFNGCTVAPVLITITVNPPLEVIAAGATSICPGASANLTAKGSGGNGTFSYLWIPAAGLNNATAQNPVATPAGTTTYTVIVSDNCGTPTDSDMVTVTVFPPPVVTFTTIDTVHCAPMCVNFAGASNPACATALWTFGDGSTSTLTCSGSRHCYTTAGLYNVTYAVTDLNGCKGSKTIPDFINVLPNPVAAFNDSPQPTTIIAPAISFTDASTNAVSWFWSFGNPGDSTSVLQNPQFTYLDTGCYTITLVVTAANGCTDQTTSPICIQPEFTFYAPNTFTPNNDGKNDTWSPKGIGIDPKNYDMMMFDRWGNLMYETHVWGQGWDGRANGGSDIAQIDTYVWKVNLKDVFGNKHSYTGHCNIIK
jgi:gliding motility-associated-like protein